MQVTCKEDAKGCENGSGDVRASEGCVCERVKERKGWVRHSNPIVLKDKADLSLNGRSNHASALAAVEPYRSKDISRTLLLGLGLGLGCHLRLRFCWDEDLVDLSRRLGNRRSPPRIRP